jgi:hypothetical protein
MRPVWLTGGALLLLLACTAPTGPGEPGELQAARQRWAERGGLDYSFELVRECSCVLGGRRIRVSVAGGAVAAAQYLDSGDSVETPFLSYLPTVPDLFDVIENALAQPAAVLEASYDPFYGYPARIELDQSAAAIDDELTLTVRGFLLDDALQRQP